MIVDNSLTLRIYATGTTPIYDSAEDLNNAQGLWFETGFPGGLCLGAGVEIPRDPRDGWEVKGTLRVEILNGLEIVYEGYIPNLTKRLGARWQGQTLDFMGAFGWLLMRRDLRKRWSDDRVDDQRWEWRTAAGGADLCNLDRRSRLRFIPKAEAWAANAYAAFRYPIPTGTIPRIDYSYDFAEGAQAWELSLWRSTDASSWTLVEETNGDTLDGAATTTQITATGTGTIGADLSGSPTYLEFRFYARAGQTPTSDGTYYANITDLMVYGSDPGTDGIRLYKICTDILTEFSDILHSSTDNLTEMTSIFELDPFVTAGYDSLANILTRAAELGDGNQARWAVGLRPSDAVPKGDRNGKPVLYMQALPDTDAGYEHTIALGAENLAQDFEIERDYDREFYNYIRVSWQDERGYEQWVTPDDEATLLDQDSIDEFGQQDYVIQLGNGTQAKAVQAGVSFLNDHSQPPWVLRSPIAVEGYIDSVDGQVTPACRIKAGDRIRVEEHDTFWISRTRYVHEPVPTCKIYVGAPQDEVYRESVFATVWHDPVPGDGDSGSGASGGGHHNYRLMGLTKKQKLLLKDLGMWYGPRGVKSAGIRAKNAGRGFKRWKDFYTGPRLPF